MAELVTGDGKTCADLFHSVQPCKVFRKDAQVYTYNVKNQLASRKSEKSETYYRYDQQGNVLEATGTEGGIYYSYNVFNQQTKVQKSDGSCLESQYDVEYLRAGTVENGEESRFLYYNGKLLAELDQNQETAGRYILGYGVAAGWNHKNEGYHSCHLDEQNSTTYITGMEGGIENRYQYDAFGVIRDSQERFGNRILYTGQQYDPITEQYYLRARFYNPAEGRFQQEDVYRGDGLNLYVYCKNNPVIYYDPSGYKLKQSDFLKIQHDDSGSGYAYYQNEHHRSGFKNRGYSNYYEGSSLQSHHLLQGEWAKTNLEAYGCDYKRAPTISLGTGYYYEDGVRKVAPHTIVNNRQNDRRDARGGNFSSTLNSELVFGATDLLNAGMSEELVFSELERNYKMLDALNEENKDKIRRGELAAIEYDREAIDEAVRATAEEQKNQKQNEGACKES